MNHGGMLHVKLCCKYDVYFFNKTWGSHEENFYRLPRGDCIFLRGRDGSGGVRIAVSGRLLAAITRVSFHAYSDRVFVKGLYFRFLSG